MVLCVVALTSFTVTTKNTTVTENSAHRYFSCEQNGHNPSKPCSRSELEKLTNPSGIILAYILLMALFPVMNLVFIVNIKELKELWRKYLENKNSLNTRNIIAMQSTLKGGQYMS